MTEMYLEMVELIFIVGGFISLIMGFLLFFKPSTVANLSQSGNKWYSGRKSTKPLDVIRETDSFYFKNNVVIGISMFFASILALLLVWNRIPTAEEVMSYGGSIEVSMSLGILLETLKWFLMVVIVLASPMWVMLAIKPESVKTINGKLNKWVSTRLLMLPLERMNNGFDVFVLHYHRFFGSLFVLGAGFILFKFLG